MRAVLQRVGSASVTVADKTIASIERGLLILLGVQKDDEAADANKLIGKIVDLRIFADDQDKMNLSLRDVQGEALVVSQFTLFADCRKGRRPSYTASAPPDRAEPLYNAFVDGLKQNNVVVKTGSFGAMMQVALTNDGPVTILLDSKDL